MSVLHSSDRKYPLQNYLQNYDRFKFHNRDVSLSIPYGRLSSKSSSISFSLPLSYPQSWQSPPLSFPTVSRLLFSPKFLLFIFLLYLPALSLCPLPAALPEDDQLKQFPPCTSHCNRDCRGFVASQLSPLQMGRWAPLHSPWPKYAEAINSIILNMLYGMTTKWLNTESWLRNFFLQKLLLWCNWHCTMQGSSYKETLHELDNYFSHSWVTGDSKQVVVTAPGLCVLSISHLKSPPCPQLKKIVLFLIAKQASLSCTHLRTL